MLAISLTITVAAMFQFAYLLTYINSAQDAFTDFVNQSYHLNHGIYLNEESFAWAWSIIVNCFQFGFLVGTIVTPLIVERIGRKWTILSSSVFDIVGTALQVASIPFQVNRIAIPKINTKIEIPWKN